MFGQINFGHGEITGAVLNLMGQIGGRIIVVEVGLKVGARVVGMGQVWEQNVCLHAGLFVLIS